jgi:hypothetical protein
MKKTEKKKSGGTLRNVILFFVGILVFSACASSGPRVENYNPDLDFETQAKLHIGPDLVMIMLDGKELGNIWKVWESYGWNYYKIIFLKPGSHKIVAELERGNLSRLRLIITADFLPGHLYELGHETTGDGFFIAASLTVEDQTDHPSPRIQNLWKERLETARQELSAKQ